MDIVTEISRMAAKELARELDFQILCDASGWTTVNFPYFLDSKHAVDISCWLEEYCEGDYRLSGSKVAFESAKDATVFSLKWL